MNIVKKLNIYIIINLFFIACKPSDAIIDIETRERIVGFKNAKYIIGDSIKLTLDEVKSFEQNGLINLKNGVLSSVSLRSSGSSKKFATNKGVAIDDKIIDIEQKYETPITRVMKINSGDVVIAELSGLGYKHWWFVTDTSGTKVNFIMLFDSNVDKKLKEREKKRQAAIH